MLGAHTLAEGRQGSRYKEPIVAMVQAFYALTRGLEILRLVSGRLRKGGGGGGVDRVQRRWPEASWSFFRKFPHAARSEVRGWGVLGGPWQHFNGPAHVGAPA